MMGSGKSYWSKQLGAYFDVPAFDLDALIEERFQMSVANVFETHGQTAFRVAEAEMLTSGIPASPCILATGGGTPCYHHNMDFMLANGFVIWLNAPISILVKRLKHNVAKRPMLAHTGGNEDLIAAKIETLLAERQPWYARAHAQIELASPGIGNFLNLLSDLNPNFI